MKTTLTTLLLCLFTATGFSQNQWDGDNAFGNLSYCNNWYGDACPSTWNSTRDFQINYKNGSQTALYQDIGWKDIQSMLFTTTFPSAVNFNTGTGGTNYGFNFWFKIENSSSYNQTINIPLSAKGTGFELNAINGDLTLTGIIYNDNNVSGNIYNSNSKSTILSNYLVGNSGVKLYLKNANYGLFKINCDMPTLSASSFSGGINVDRGELWFNAGAAINGGTLRIGNGDANICKLYINANGGTTVSNAITVPASSTNVYIGGLGTSGTNIYSGTISLSSAATIENANGGSLNVQGVVSGSQAVNIGNTTGSGNATIIYSTNAKTYTGLTTVGANSTLKLNVANALPSTNNITVNNSATLQVSSNQTIANLNLSAGGNLTVDAGTTLTITGTYTGGAGTINNQGTIVLQGAAQQTFPGATAVINNGTSGALTNLTINNSNGVVLNKDITVAGALTLTAGNLSVNGKTLTLAGTVSVAGAISASSSSSTVVISGPSTLPSGLFTANTVNNLTINRSGGVVMGSNLSINGVYSAVSGKLSIAGNTLTLVGTVSGMSATNSFTGSNTSKIIIESATSLGTIYFDQNTSADVTTTNGTNALQNFEFTGSNGDATLGNKLNVFNKLTVNNGTLNTGGNLVLRSTSTGTAYVDQIIGGTIEGTVVVERYYHKQFRGWRAVTAPISFAGLTITDSSNMMFKNWQSNFGYSANYGTRVTGKVTPSATNGLDDSTNSSSLMTYNSSTAAWNKIVNTKTETIAGNTGAGNADNKSFFMFVRGDRSVLPVVGTPNTFVTTTLAAKGLLQTGNITATYTGAAGNSWLTGNPYACAVDMSNLTYTNIPNTVYVWDPNLVGANTNLPGGYTSFDRTTWGAPLAGSTTKYFQSGQAFFVKPTSTTASIEYNESNKAGTSQNTQTTGIANALTDIFNVKLYAVQAGGDRTNVDGLRAKFGNYSDAVDEQDGLKLENTIENIYIAKGTDKLAIEARPYITGTESLYLNMSNMVAGANYEFTFNPINFDASVSSCKLVDNFLNIETPISLTSNTTIGFNITNVAGSNAANRFTVVFNAAGSLPVNSLTVKAYKKNNSVIVEWQTTVETGVKTFVVEKSVTGTSFQNLTETTAKNNNTSNTYSITDNNPVNGVNYYRIKTTSINSNEKYSAIVRVEMTDKGIKSVTVYPNPVTGKEIGLQLNNLAAGNYTAKMFNIAGQEVYSTILQHNGNNGSTSLQLNNKLAAGTYQLQLTDTKGTTYQQKVLVVE
jgi:Secretion system C-terminal sorting domain